MKTNMRKKLTKWLIWTLSISFILWGFIYHTFFMLFFLLFVIGGSYLLFKNAKKIMDYINNRKS